MEPNPILFGRDPTPSIVAVEIHEGREAQVYRREGDRVEKIVSAFTPFLLLEDLRLLKDWEGEHEARALKGETTYRCLVAVPSWKELQSLIKFLSKTTGLTAGALDAPFYFQNDPVHQYLLLTGRTLFKGMVFDDLVRLQLDIETYCAPGFEFSNPQRAEDRIIAISMSDNRGWERVISGQRKTEEEMLLE
ncbi:MAG: DNA polymerase domain-containing protein, partial [Nitrospiria bacterium]